MTSKEAIEEINNILREEVPFSQCNHITEPIEKDLKVLKIIKEHKLLNYVLKNKKCANMYKLTDKEIDILKEWLENDN